MKLTGQAHKISSTDTRCNGSREMNRPKPSPNSEDPLICIRVERPDKSGREWFILTILPIPGGPGDSPSFGEGGDLLEGGITAITFRQDPLLSKGGERPDLSGRGWFVRWTLSDSIKAGDIRHHLVWKIENRTVLNADNSYPHGLEITRPPVIVLGLQRIFVSSTIEFNPQLLGCAIEIEDVTTNTMLPAEFSPMQLAALEHLPEPHLRCCAVVT